MARISAEEAGGRNVCAFLDAIKVSELGEGLIAASDDGYNVIVGSTASFPDLFHDYSAHPNKLISLPRLGISSTAAGAYQLLYRYWIAYRDSLALPDFSPVSQDRIAIQQIKERRAFNLVVAGHFEEAIAAVKNIWASLPGAGYGQHENNLDALRAAYVSAGGVVA
jgi:muramidase (phage lysozyme)